MRKRKVLSRRLPDHGPMFTATLTALFREFGSGTNRADLADAYAHFEVAMATAEDHAVCRRLVGIRDRAMHPTPHRTPGDRHRSP
jgi:hypothetical protein